MRTFIIVLILALAACQLGPATARADIVDEARAVAALHEEDPFVTLGPVVIQQARAAESQGDLVQALELYRIAVTIDRADRVSLKRAREIKTELIERSKARFKSGLAKFEAGDADAARPDFLASLELDPENLSALPYLKEGYSPKVMDTYTIAEGDTLRRIADKVYGNPGAELLLTRINNLSIVDVLKPGETLKTPVLDKRLARRLHAEAPASTKPGKASKEEAVVVTVQEAASSTLMTDDFMTEDEGGGTEALLVMATVQFGNGLYETAVSMTDEILSGDPGNAKAQEIRNESYYALARQRWDEQQAAAAMRSLIRLPKGYKDSAKLRKQVEDKLTADSEPLYLAGVKHFLNENLEQAVEQWELTLTVNPYHAKARADLEKARKLLEAVKGL